MLAALCLDIATVAAVLSYLLIADSYYLLVSTHVMTGACMVRCSSHKPASDACHGNSSMHMPSAVPPGLHSTAQHSTAQHSTAQHSTAQHSKARQSSAQQRPQTQPPYLQCLIGFAAVGGASMIDDSALQGSGHGIPLVRFAHINSLHSSPGHERMLQSVHKTSDSHVVQGEHL